jgi:hypothetical protein
MSSQNNSSTWCSMPRSTNRPVQCRLHGRPPVRFLRRFSVPSVQRVSLRGNPDPGRLSHAHSKPPPGQQEVSSALRAPARRRGGQGQGEARSWRWKEQAGHGSWSGNLRRSEGEAGAEFVDEESILVPPGHGISEVRRFGSFAASVSAAWPHVKRKERGCWRDWPSSWMDGLGQRLRRRRRQIKEYSLPS